MTFIDFRLIDLILLVAVAVEGVVLYWLVKYGDQFRDEFKDEAKRDFTNKWK